jgi:poly(A) polymerase
MSMSWGSLRKRKPRVIVVDRDKHILSRKNIDSDALKVLSHLNRHDHVACLAGGAVRDLLLERTPKDFDVTTSAHPNEVKKLFKNSVLIGRRFRLAHIRFGRKIIECSTFRKKPEPVDATNEEEASLYQHRDNSFGTPEEDAWRRDFTINGLFYDLRRFEVVDYVGGLEDLEKKVIRTIGDPDVRMQEDPVRMLRAIRFASRLGFKIERRTWKAIRKQRREILKAAPARLTDEIQKLFSHGAGHDAMRLLKEAGLLKDLLPWVDKYLSSSADKGKLFWRCLQALDANKAVDGNPPPSLVFASMAYPMFLEKMAVARKKDERVSSLDVAQEMLTGSNGKPVIPRWDFYRVSNIFDAQRRFETWTGGRFSKKRFVCRPDFRASAAFYDIQTTARDIKISSKKPWMDLYKESAPPPERSERKRPPARRGRRGGRGRRPPPRDKKS